MLGEQGHAEPLAVQETGLGRYRALVPLAGQRRLTVRLHDVWYDKLKVLCFQQPYPAEYQLAQWMPPAIAAIPEAPEALVADVAPLDGRQSILPYFYFAAILSLLGSVLLRRV